MVTKNGLEFEYKRLNKKYIFLVKEIGRLQDFNRRLSRRIQLVEERLNNFAKDGRREQ